MTAGQYLGFAAMMLSGEKRWKRVARYWRERFLKQRQEEDRSMLSVRWEMPTGNYDIYLDSRDSKIDDVERM